MATLVQSIDRDALGVPDGVALSCHDTESFQDVFGAVPMEVWPAGGSEISAATARSSWTEDVTVKLSVDVAQAPDIAPHEPCRRKEVELVFRLVSEGELRTVARRDEKLKEALISFRNEYSDHPNGGDEENAEAQTSLSVLLITGPLGNWDGATSHEPDFLITRIGQALAVNDDLPVYRVALVVHEIERRLARLTPLPSDPGSYRKTAYELALWPDFMRKFLSDLVESRTLLAKLSTVSAVFSRSTQWPLRIFASSSLGILASEGDVNFDPVTERPIVTPAGWLHFRNTEDTSQNRHFWSNESPDWRPLLTADAVIYLVTGIPSLFSIPARSLGEDYLRPVDPSRRPPVVAA